MVGSEGTQNASTFSLQLETSRVLMLMPRYGVWSMPLVMVAVALILVILVSIVTGATLGGTKGHTVLQLDSTDSEEIDPWVDQPGPWIDQDQPHSAATKAASSSLETSFKKVIDNRHFTISNREQSSR